MDFLLLRLEAPLMAFGGPIVDNRGVTRRFPAVSMVAGLCANALGLSHRDVGAIQDLQDRLSVAARCDRRGERLEDYQTVDLYNPMFEGGWTTRGKPDPRTKLTGGLHVRQRSYLADAVYTIAIALESGTPDLDELEAAFDRPARPLVVGRKCCLPSRPLLLARRRADSFEAALQAVPRSTRADRGPLTAWWPVDRLEGAGPDVFAVCDRRDWSNQVHVGRRGVRRATVDPKEVSDVER